MPLTIGVREGESFYVNDTRCLIAELHDATRMKIDVCGPMTKRFEVNAKVQTEIMPGVMVQTGVVHKGMATVVVDASRDKVILRENLYDKQNAD